MKGRIILVRGGGDLATGTIYALHSCGFRVLVLEIPQPTAIRRTVAFCEALYEDCQTVEDVCAVRISDPEEAYTVWDRDQIPVIADPAARCLDIFKPFCFVDAAIAKRNLGTRIDMAPLVIALGPGFTAGTDCHVVIETKRGHRLGRLIREGSAAPNTGIPGIIAGYGKERVIHAPCAGIFREAAAIGDNVCQGDVIAYIDDQPVRATLDGILRGLLRSGLRVPEGFKVADIDPRQTEKDNCHTISDKSRAIAGGVLLAVGMYLKDKVLI